MGGPAPPLTEPVRLVRSRAHRSAKSGAADVWIEFTVKVGRSSALSIHDDDLAVTATRKSLAMGGLEPLA